MSEKDTYTEDDIRRVGRITGQSENAEKIIAELKLKLPKQQFKKGEVLAYLPDSNYLYDVYRGKGYLSDITRHLTQTEAGPWGEAVEASIGAMEYVAKNTHDASAREGLRVYIEEIKSILPETSDD